MTTTQKPLLSAEDIAAMPRLYAQDGLGDAAIVHAHIFGPVGDWWITEVSEDGTEAFGFTKLTSYPDGEFGYISISELQSIADMFYEKKDIKYLLEKDEYWEPKPAKDCIHN